MSAPPAKLILLTAASDFKNLFNSKTTTTLYPTNISNFWQHELKRPKITVKAEKREKKKITLQQAGRKMQSTPCNTVKIFVVWHEI